MIGSAMVGIIIGGGAGFKQSEWMRLLLYDKCDIETVNLASTWYMKLCVAELIQAKTNGVDNAEQAMPKDAGKHSGVTDGGRKGP